jgi:6-phosphogluconolactonase (cycloisomerase 2 family)
MQLSAAVEAGIAASSPTYNATLKNGPAIFTGCYKCNRYIRRKSQTQGVIPPQAWNKETETELPDSECNVWSEVLTL